MNDISVSVYMTTCNSAKHIRQALDSVLMQECNFEYEIVVGDDCSEDETQSILLEYQQENSDKFKLFFHDEKLGLMLNFMKTWESCRGKYVALLDANDYWQDPYKLQKQVDFLEQNEECSACYHDTLVLGAQDKQVADTFGRYKNYNREEQLCGMAVMQFSTRIIRNMKIELPNYFFELQQPDTIIGHFSGFHGEAGFLKSVEKSIYRLPYHNEISSDRFHRLKINAETKKMILKHLGEESQYKEVMNKSIIALYIDALYVTLRDEKVPVYFFLWKEVFASKELNIWKMMTLHAEDIVVKVMAKIKK